MGDPLNNLFGAFSAHETQKGKSRKRNPEPLKISWVLSQRAGPAWRTGAHLAPPAVPIRPRPRMGFPGGSTGAGLGPPSVSTHSDWQLQEQGLWGFELCPRGVQIIKIKW